MNLFLRLYDREILKYGIYSALLLWGLTVSVALLLRKDHLVVVRVDDFGTTILSEESSKTATIETENFVNDFVALFYNYTSENFDSHIDKSFQFIDDSVAKGFVPKLNEMSDKMKLRPTHQRAVATKITKIKEGQFEIELLVTKTVGLDETQDRYKLNCELERTRRSIENPYGLLITKLEEIYE